MSHDRILIATDGSNPADEATKEAVSFAKAFDATLYALHVLEAAEPPPWVDDPEAQPGVDTKAGRALNGVVSTAEEQGLQSEVVMAAVKGRTAEAIVDYATEHDVDLIVMGTHGRTGLDRLVIGSVAERVVRESPIPVVTV